MDIPSATTMRDWSQLDFAEKGFTSDTALDRLIARAAAGLATITGYDDLALTPTVQNPLFEQALQGLTEQLAFSQSEDYLETLSDWDLILSFSAGPYSETHRSPKDARDARMLNAWPWLSSLLWTILTPDRYDYWVSFFGGVNPPAFAVTEMDWGAYQDVPQIPGGWLPAPYGD